MPFNCDVRRRLLVLKEEKDCGLLPQVVYEEMCRAVISEFGDKVYPPASSTKFASNSDAESTESDTDSKFSTSSSQPQVQNNNFASSEAANTYSSIYEPNPLATSHLQSGTAQPFSYSRGITSTSDHNNISTTTNTTNCIDGRTFNKGQSQRRSYS